ncbi:MAG TPA: hypothetical protein VN777_11580 [Terriglobales bacterium]|nr:hypothetical protein [Terriglobales bacterium]
MFAETYYFCDVNMNRLPEGTAIKFPSMIRHEAIIAYNFYGQQVLLEKSKKYGKPTVANPEEYRGIPFEISRNPSSPSHGIHILEHAYAEIQAGGTRWTPFDNCQDFVSRAYAGRNGSETRNFVLGALALAGIAGIAAASSSR